MTREMHPKEIEKFVLIQLGKLNLNENTKRAKNICDRLGYKSMQNYIGFASKLKKYDRNESENFLNVFNEHVEDLLYFYNNETQTISNLIEFYNYQSQLSKKLKNEILVEYKTQNNKIIKLDFWIKRSLDDFYNKIENILNELYPYKQIVKNQGWE